MSGDTLIKKEIVQLFNKLDKDGNGELTREELSGFLIENFSEKLTPELVKGIFDAFDRNFDGKITLDEFKNKIEYTNFVPSDIINPHQESLMAQGANLEMQPEMFKQAITEESKTRMTYLFHKADKDKNGTLSREELADLLKDEYGNYDESVDKTFTLVDKNKDDKLTLDEFMGIWNYDLVKQLLRLNI